MLTIHNTGLVVVDVQGRLARLVHDSENVVANIAKLIKGAEALNLPIIWLEQNPDKLGETIPELRGLLSRYKPIAKYTFNGVGADAFVETVEKSKCTDWLICGIETHICVYQTALGLLARGYNVELVIDGVSSRTLHNKELAISKLSSKGVGLTSFEMCLYELLGDCRSPEFRRILRLVK
jgi:nicotinamidase-related amidase